MKRGRDQFLKYKKLLYFFSSLLRSFPISLRIWFYYRFTNCRGIIGIAIRYVILKSIARECGDNVSIHENVYLFNIDKMILGSNISIHPMCYINAEAGLVLADNISIAHSATIITTNHKYSDSELPIKDQNFESKGVQIQSNVWIGAKATIMPGVKIEKGCVIGAHSLVNKNTQINSIVGGIPARLIKSRF